MKQFFLYSALTLSLAMTAVHVFVGGRLIAEPLLESALSDLPRLTLYFCWHGVTIVLAGLAIFSADAIFRRRSSSAILVAALSASFVLLNIFLIVRFSLSPFALPQWAILAPLSLSAFVGGRMVQRER